MSKAEENLFPFVTLVESDPDGSAVDNPPAGSRRIFPGDDGAWYDKDSAGDVDAVGGGGGGGSFSAADVEEAVLGANVALGTTAYGNDLLSLALDAGFYFVAWKLAATPGGQTSVYAVLWNDDEDTIFDEGEGTLLNTSGWRYAVMSGWAFVTLAAPETIKLSAHRSSDSTASALRDGGQSTSHTLTKLSAIKLG